MFKALLQQSSTRAARFVVVCVGTLVAGCAATVQENHYFAAFNEPTPGAREPVQFYRVSVDGNTQFANARYLTGYFDERAVTLFFNELKSPPDGRLFEQNRTLPGTDTKLTPLNAPAGEGAFVLIMSTNADSIAATIGAFAESQVVADSLTRILNRDRFKAKVQSDAMVPVSQAEARALTGRVEAQVKSAKDAPTGEHAAANYRRALTALAQSLGYRGAEFATVAQAEAWFAIESTRTGVSP